ncbi:MAG: hypothetical protein FWG31_05970 [Oscillospiraceae bacterium]|nr:hypothetical protein [Oscillospiraceae bacterium]
MTNQTDKQKDKTGALFFGLTGAAVSVFVPILFAAAGFLAFAPWLNIASAVVLTPAALTVLYWVFSKKTRMQVMFSRCLTAAMSALGAYLYICMMTGMLSGIFGAIPLESIDMREYELTEVLSGVPTGLANGIAYLVSPGTLWQDVTAWVDGGWPLIAAAALFAQIGLPQLFIRRPPEETPQF